MLVIFFFNKEYEANASNPFSLIHYFAKVMRVNYTCVLNVSNALFPLLRAHSRVVHLTSRFGCVYYVKNASIKDKLLKDNLTIEEIDEILKEYLTLDIF